MRRIGILTMVTVYLVALPGIVAEAPALESDDDKILYTLGLAISQNLSTLDLNDRELALIQAGLADGVLGREPRVTLADYAPRIQSMLQVRVAKITEREKEAGTAFCAAAAGEPGAVKTESGLVYLEIEPGDGPSPGPTDTVKLHYHGTLRDGEVFDSSLEGEPVTFTVNGVIGCFGEGLQRMKVGGKSKLTCPSTIAYGDRGSPPSIRPGATLVFEVQLLEVAGQPESSPAVP